MPVFNLYLKIKLYIRNFISKRNVKFLKNSRNNYYCSSQINQLQTYINELLQYPYLLEEHHDKLLSYWKNTVLVEKQSKSIWTNLFGVINIAVVGYFLTFSYKNAILSSLPITGFAFCKIFSVTLKKYKKNVILETLDSLRSIYKLNREIYSYLQNKEDQLNVVRDSLSTNSRHLTFLEFLIESNVNTCLALKAVCLNNGLISKEEPEYEDFLFFKAENYLNRLNVHPNETLTLYNELIEMFLLLTNDFISSLGLFLINQPAFTDDVVIIKLKPMLDLLEDTKFKLEMNYKKYSNPVVAKFKSETVDTKISTSLKRYLFSMGNALDLSNEVARKIEQGVTNSDNVHNLMQAISSELQLCRSNFEDFCNIYSLVTNKTLMDLDKENLLNENHIHNFKKDGADKDAVTIDENTPQMINDEEYELILTGDEDLREPYYDEEENNPPPKLNLKEVLQAVKHYRVKNNMKLYTQEDEGENKTNIEAADNHQIRTDVTQICNREETGGEEGNRCEEYRNRVPPIVFKRSALNETDESSDDESSNQIIDINVNRMRLPPPMLHLRKTEDVFLAEPEDEDQE